MGPVTLDTYPEHGLGSHIHTAGHMGPCLIYDCVLVGVSSWRPQNDLPNGHAKPCVSRAKGTQGSGCGHMSHQVVTIQGHSRNPRGRSASSQAPYSLLGWPVLVGQEEREVTAGSPRGPPFSMSCGEGASLRGQSPVCDLSSAPKIGLVCPGAALDGFPETAQGLQLPGSRTHSSIYKDLPMISWPSIWRW